MEKVRAIQKVVKDYFYNNPSVSIIPAKDLMPYFIEANIFSKDEKNGLPIRKVLRQLDERNELHLLPHLIAERKTKNTNWFFGREKRTQIQPKAEKKRLQTKAEPLEIPRNELELIEFDYSEFAHTNGKRLLRNKDEDEKIIREKLKKYIN
ncbi:hypothetical protein JI747_005225 [Chryseobacterium sp. RG1]|uniref:Uncharacterized protein n=1 Tax=Chryseobacterium tagetis TaxID=2801334 RepID=A0ABS8A1K1_9FLAO|nr:hypothetical protein [Chryseobacterium tagetis]MCA6066571.1 hypothetical protein [Chryseobacterium tagetis]